MYFRQRPVPPKFGAAQKKVGSFRSRVFIRAQGAMDFGYTIKVTRLWAATLSRQTVCDETARERVGDSRLDSPSLPYDLTALGLYM